MSLFKYEMPYNWVIVEFEESTKMYRVYLQLDFGETAIDSPIIATFLKKKDAVEYAVKYFEPEEERVCMYLEFCNKFILSENELDEYYEWNKMFG